uniref:Cytochrome n=1 Tax=Lutzomyia longipalpis TaxID=7200 RepID=A0A1B0CII4_LUTLO
MPHKVFFAKTSITDFVRDIYESTCGEDFIGLYAIFRPILFVRNSDLCRNILIKDFQSFHDRGVYVNEKKDPLSGHLFSLSGEKWKQLRAKLTPAFTSGRLKAMFQTLIDCGVNLEEFINVQADQGTEIEMRDLMARYTTTVIASVGFGIEEDSIVQPNAPFRMNGRKVFAPTLKNGLRNMLFLMAPKVAKMISLKTVDNDYEDFIFSMVKQSIDYREKSGIQRKDFIQLLLQLRNTGKVDYGDDWNFVSSKEDLSFRITDGCIAIALHFYIQHIYSYWDRKKIKSIKPVFPFGNLKDGFLLKKPFAELFMDLYKQTDEPLLGLYATTKPALMVRDPELLRLILIRDFQYFHDRGVYVNEDSDPLSGHLFSLNGGKWKNLRAKLTPTFTSGRLKAMFQTFLDCGNSLEAHLMKNTNKEVDMRDLMARYTTNIIASVAFGLDSDAIAEPKDTFRIMGKKVRE